VIDAMDEYQNIDQHQVDKVFEQVADVIQQQAFRSVARSVRTRHYRMVDTRVCCDRSRHRRRMRVVHQKCQTGNSL
jgi:hypothetical protein